MDAGRGTDADAADPAVERVRRELALLGHDDASAPEVPAEVTARIGAALRAAGAPAHSITRPRLRRGQVLGLAIGLIAVLAGVVLGAALLKSPRGSSYPAGPTAESITVSRPDFPLGSAEVLAVAGAPPDYGALVDSRACLQSLGRAAARVLGARPLAAGVVLVLSGEAPDTVVALLVTPECGAAHTGLVAETVVRRP